VPAVHTDALAGSGETWRWMSAAAGASGDQVLASHYNAQVIHCMGFRGAHKSASTSSDDIITMLLSQF